MRIILFLGVCLAIVSCKSRQNEPDAPLGAIALFESGSGMMMHGLRTEFELPDSSRFYYRQALAYFLAAWQKDSSQIEVAIYLPDVYAKLGKQDSAAYWANRLKNVSTE